MDKLPQEILQFILNFLEPRPFDQARSVCTRWFKIINKRSFTLYCIKNHDLEALERAFCRYEYPVELRFKKTKRITEHAQLAQCLARLTNLTSLSIATDKISNAWLALTALTGLKQLKLEDPPMDLVAKLPQLNKLHLVRTYRFMDKLHVFSTLTALQDLKITFADQDDYSGLLSSLPNPSLLTRLIFNGSNMSDFAAIERFYNMKDLVLDYWSTMFESEEPFPLKFSAIESLMVNGTNVSVEDITLNTTLTHLTLGSIQCTSFENFSRLSKLQTLQISAITTPSEQIGKGFIFLTSLSALRNLTVEETAGKFSAYLSTNVTSLIYSIYEGEDLQWDRLANLRDLRFTVHSPEHDVDALLNIEKLSKLTRLDLKLHTINTEIMKRLPTTLRELDLFTGATNVVEMDLTNRQQLTKLNLANVIVDPICLEKLADLAALEYFEANWWQPELTGLSALQHLTHLKMTQDDTSMAQSILPLLTNLRELNMTPLSDAAIRQLTALKNLTFLVCLEMESDGYILTCLTSLQQAIIVANMKNSTESKATVKENLLKALPNTLFVFV